MWFWLSIDALQLVLALLTTQEKINNKKNVRAGEHNVNKSGHHEKMKVEWKINLG